MRRVIVRVLWVTLALGIAPAKAQEPRRTSAEAQASDADGAGADRRPEEDLTRWIGDACPSTSDLVALMRLDQVAGKAVTDWLRTGRYRDALALAMRYYDCLKRPGLAEADTAALADGLLAGRVAMLEQVLCFLPLVLIETEQKVDVELAAQSLARCPRPPLQPPEDRAAWGEAVRRYLHLVAAARPPAVVFSEVMAYLQAMREAGFPFPERRRAPPTSGQEAERVPEDSEAGPPEEEGPDPVFAAMVLGIGAAVADGDLDGLVRVVRAGEEGSRTAGGTGTGSVEGDSTDVCSSPFLAALGIMQAVVGSSSRSGVVLPRRAALPILQVALVRRAPLDARMRTVRASIERFSRERGARGDKDAPAEERPCVVLQVVASLVLGSLDNETFDRAVAEGKAQDLAMLVSATTIAVGLPGSPEARLSVLRMVADQAQTDDERGRWWCAVGDAALEAGRTGEAASAFGRASAFAMEPGKTCGPRGMLKALIADPGAKPERVVAAAEAFLATKPDAQDVYGLIAGAQGPPAKAAAIRALAVAGRSGRGLVEPVLEALVKVVDVDPGSEAARLALDAVARAGGPERPEERVVFGLVSGRHHVVARQEDQAIRTLSEAFSLARPEAEGVKDGTAALLRWLAANDHVRVLDRAVSMARRARAVDAIVLAQVGAIRGERGDRKRAKALLRLAVLARPTSPEDWLAVADAYARIGEPVLASAALEKAGPEASWDRRHYMTKGRIEMDRRRYREAAAAYTKAADLARGECEPLFFRGLVRLLLGDAEGAAQDFEQCLALQEDSPSVLGGLAYAYFDQSVWDKAEHTFREALAKDERTADNHIGLALTLFRLGRLEEARKSYERAVQLEPAMGKGYAEAEKKGYVYSAIEKQAWNEMVRALRASKRRGR